MTTIHANPVIKAELSATTATQQMPASIAAQELIKVRAEGRKVREQVESLVKNIHGLDGEIALAEADWASLDGAFAAHLAARPDEDDFPSDQELADWQTELDRLRALRSEKSQAVMQLKGERAGLANQAVALDATLMRLQQAQRNLQTLASGGRLGQFPEGGMRAV
jgi:chromosome segregation ATPase